MNIWLKQQQSPQPKDDVREKKKEKFYRDMYKKYKKKLTEERAQKINWSTGHD
jgi:hypothetical protein